ncbi:MAG: hypothetical protein AAGK04_12995 [Planctomycetota bacterium]
MITKDQQEHATQIEETMALYEWVCKRSLSGGDDASSRFVSFATILPGMEGIGATESEALDDAKDAVRLYLNGRLAAGRPIPTPKDHSKDKRVFQINIRVTQDERDMIVRSANESDCSVSNYVRARALDPEHGKTRAPKSGTPKSKSPKNKTPKKVAAKPSAAKPTASKGSKSPAKSPNGTSARRKKRTAPKPSMEDSKTP